MGWKSTIDITREEAIYAIISSLEKKPYDDMTNEELENLMYELGIGDDINKPYFGHNFNIYDNENNKIDEF